MKCFSPVAGIQWVETAYHSRTFEKEVLVSVPLPGFSGLRRPKVLVFMLLHWFCFSPVAGIQWVETRIA